MTNNIAPLILAVDDDPDFLEIIEARLRAKGFQTITATDGAEAVEKAKRYKPAVIVMDVQMPNQDGISATVVLRADMETRNIPVVFLTNLGDSSMEGMNQKFAQEIGAADYFRKSDDYQPLLRKVGMLAVSH